MELKNFGALISGFIVAALLVTAILVPIIGSTTATEGTFTNEGMYYMTYVPEGESHQLVFVPGSGWTFDGEPLTGIGSNNTVIGTEDFVIRGDGRARGILNSIGNVTISMTISADTITGTLGNQTINTTYDKIIIATPDESDLVMKAAETVAYVLGDSEIEGYGYTIITIGDSTQNNMVIHIDGNIIDGFTITAVPSGDVTVNYRVENITTDADYVSTYDDLYTISKITFDVIVTDDNLEEYTTSCTYNMIVVPAYTTAELAQHLDNTEISLLGIIPLLVTVGILLGIVGVIFTRRE